MSDERWPTLRQRMSMTQSGRFYRPVNGWGAGDLPAPWAEGDLVRLPEDAVGERLPKDGPGLFVVTYATSVDEGDAWYFRVGKFRSENGSDRLHVGFPERASSHWADNGCDYMAPFTLVDTQDPHGLTLRRVLVEAGWRMDGKCPACPPEETS